MRSRSFLWIILLVAGVLIGNSCFLADSCGTNKDQFLDHFANLMEEVDEARPPLGDPAWEAFDERFRSLVEECYEKHEADLSGAEKRRFWAQSMGYYKDRYGKASLDKWLRGKKTD
jgi:hypothetical protein